MKKKSKLVINGDILQLKKELKEFREYTRNLDKNKDKKNKIYSDAHISRLFRKDGLDVSKGRIQAIFNQSVTSEPDISLCFKIATFLTKCQGGSILFSRIPKKFKELRKYLEKFYPASEIGIDIPLAHISFSKDAEYGIIGELCQQSGITKKRLRKLRGEPAVRKLNNLLSQGVLIEDPKTKKIRTPDPIIFRSTNDGGDAIPEMFKHLSKEDKDNGDSHGKAMARETTESFKKYAQNLMVETYEKIREESVLPENIGNTKLFFISSMIKVYDEDDD